MKLFTATFLTASLISLHALMAQDAGTVPIPDNNPSAQPTPSPLFPSGTPPPVVNRPAHSGAGAPDTDHPASRNPPVKMNKSTVTAESVADNIAYRKAKTKALRDEKVQQAYEEADNAKTDVAKRAALKRFYTLLADRILKIDGSIKKLVAERLKASLSELNQDKVRPEDYPQQASAEH